MGSGSGGGGGGGGGSSSSGGAGYSVIGGGSGDSHLIPRTKAEIDTVFNEFLSGPPREYYLSIFASNLVLDIYAGLIDVSVWICLDRNWQSIEHKYQVSPDPGCLIRLTEAMVQMHGGDDADPLVREICFKALQSLFIYSMGDSPSQYGAADANKVFQKVKRKVLVDSRSSYFLRELISEVADRRNAELPSELRSSVHRYSLERADVIIDDFETRFKDQDPQGSHNHLFRVIRDNQEWFLNLLKKGAT
jgi:hypothetical protein